MIKQHYAPVILPNELNLGQQPVWEVFRLRIVSMITNKPKIFIKIKTFSKFLRYVL